MIWLVICSFFLFHLLTYLTCALLLLQEVELLCTFRKRFKEPASTWSVATEDRYNWWVGQQQCYKTSLTFLFLHLQGLLTVSRKLPTYSSPKPTLTLTSLLGQNFGLGEGQVDNYPLWLQMHVKKPYPSVFSASSLNCVVWMLCLRFPICNSNIFTLADASGKGM